MRRATLSLLLLLCPLLAHANRRAAEVPGPKLPAQAPPNADPVPGAATVTVFSTGDIHEHTAQIARIAGYVKAFRAKDPNVLLLDAGDMTGGYGEREMISTWGHGMWALLEAAGYDGCILGNWDYGLGKDKILTLCAAYPKFPLLFANVRWGKDEREAAERIPPYKVFRMKGVTVAVIGTGSTDMRYARKKRFALGHQAGTIHAYVRRLRKEKAADIIIAVTHQYEGLDLATATGPDAPDLIVGGHSHGAFVAPYGREKKSFIMKPGPWTKRLAKVVITWDGTKIVEKKGELLQIGKDWPEDPGVKAIRDAIFKKAAARKKAKKK